VQDSEGQDDDEEQEAGTVICAVMRAYNIPNVDLLEAIYSRTTACMDPEDASCVIITFLTGVIQGTVEHPRQGFLRFLSMPFWNT
jgi:hypothetical protein